MLNKLMSNNHHICTIFWDTVSPWLDKRATYLQTRGGTPTEFCKLEQILQKMFTCTVCAYKHSQANLSKDTQQDNGFSKLISVNPRIPQNEESTKDKRNLDSILFFSLLPLNSKQQNLQLMLCTLNTTYWSKVEIYKPTDTQPQWLLNTDCPP